MDWRDRIDGIYSNQINGTYYVRFDIEPNEWFAEWCGPHDMDILLSGATIEECKQVCENHYIEVIRCEVYYLRGLDKII